MVTSQPRPGECAAYDSEPQSLTDLETPELSALLKTAAPFMGTGHPGRLSKPNSENTICTNKMVTAQPRSMACTANAIYNHAKTTHTPKTKTATQNPIRIPDLGIPWTRNPKQQKPARNHAKLAPRPVHPRFRISRFRVSHIPIRDSSLDQQPHTGQDAPRREPRAIPPRLGGAEGHNSLRIRAHLSESTYGAY